MTEAAYQACRNLMQRANYRRSQITKAEGEVAKWTRIDAVQQTKKTADALLKAMKRLEDERKRFAELQFPDPNLASVDSRCPDCQMKIKIGKSHVCHEY